MPCYSPAKPPVSISDSEEQISYSSGENDNKLEHSGHTDDNLGHQKITQNDTSQKSSDEDQPPLPEEVPPPLPDEAPPSDSKDDGWEPVWDDSAQSFYFYNRITQKTQWKNPRVPEENTLAGTAIEDNGPPGTTLHSLPRKPVAGGYDPAIHGNYDPTADYAKVYEPMQEENEHEGTAAADPAAAYAATGAFNRFTGKWQSADVTPDKFNDENKSKRQMNAFFDVDAAANAHEGKSLKAERSGKKISKEQLKAYREKRKEKKEEKRRAWLRD